MRAPQSADACGTAAPRTDACELCGVPIVSGVLLARQESGHVMQRDVLVEPQLLDLVMPVADPGLLLHLGRFANTDRWLLVTADDRAVPGTVRMLRNPHVHRLHVCAGVPAGWLNAALTATGTS